MRMAFSWPRLVAGIAMLLAAMALSMALLIGAGAKGAWLIVILCLPISIAGLRRVLRPFTLRCSACQGGPRFGRALPFSITLLPAVTEAATSFDPGRISNLAMTGPLPDPPPSPYCALRPVICARCGQTGALQALRLRHTSNYAFAAIDRIVVRDGVVIDAPFIAWLAQTSEWPWAHTQQRAGFLHA